MRSTQEQQPAMQDNGLDKFVGQAVMARKDWIKCGIDGNPLSESVLVPDVYTPQQVVVSEDMNADVCEAGWGD